MIAGATGKLEGKVGTPVFSFQECEIAVAARVGGRILLGFRTPNWNPGLHEAFMPAKSSVTQKTITLSKVGAVLGLIAAWTWTLFAGGGGVGLLIIRRPWKLTHGWFAVFSGLSVCPPTAWLAKRYLGVTLSGWVRITAAILFIVAGRIALRVGL